MPSQINVENVHVLLLIIGYVLRPTSITVLIPLYKGIYFI